MAKRNFWLKLTEDYFNSPKIKKLRSIAGGDTYALIYLKLQCYSTKHDGVFIYEGVEDTLADEIALVLDEKKENVEVLIAYLEKFKMIEYLYDNKYLLPEAANNIGSESSSAARVRKWRETKKQKELEHQGNIKALHCNTTETDGNKMCSYLEKSREDKIENKRREREREEEDTSTTTSDDLEYILKIFLREISHTYLASPNEIDTLKQMIKKYTAPKVVEAINIAVMRNKKSLGYIQGILSRNENTNASSHGGLSEEYNIDC